MTIPYFSNCSHGPTGWCSECISDLGREILDKDEYISNLEKWLKKVGDIINDENWCLTKESCKQIGNGFYDWYDNQESIEQKIKLVKKQTALAKLTDEEKEILGL